jgi:hypothetical protein
VTSDLSAKLKYSGSTSLYYWPFQKYGIIKILIARFINWDPEQLDRYRDRLRAGRPGERDFSLLRSVQTSSAVHTVACEMGTEGLFLVGKAAGV